MPRNPRPTWRGIGGRHAAESVAGIGRNTHNVTANAADARVFGAEFEGLVQLTNDLHLGGNFAYFNSCTRIPLPV